MHETRIDCLFVHVTCHFHAHNSQFLFNSANGTLDSNDLVLYEIPLGMEIKNPDLEHIYIIRLYHKAHSTCVIAYRVEQMDTFQFSIFYISS